MANNAQLERDYAVARGNDSKPVLLTVDGHFTLEPNPDSGEMVKTLWQIKTRSLLRVKTVTVNKLTLSH